MRTGRVQYFRTLEPQLRGLDKVRQKDPMYVGMHCRGDYDLEYAVQSFAPINVLEVKPEHRSEPLFVPDASGLFSLHDKNFSSFYRKARGLETDQELALQFHFPPSLSGVSLNPADLAQHDAILSLFSSIAGAVSQYGLLPNVTFHLPAIIWSGKSVFDGGEDKALDNTRWLFDRIGEAQLKHSWPIVIGVENQADPKKNAHVLGYLIEHFATVMKDTSDCINFTIDTGHRLLSRNLSVRDILALADYLGKRIINFHMHENLGIITDSYKDDLHNLPMENRIPGMLNFLNRAVQYRIPIIFEVNTRTNKNPYQLNMVTGSALYNMGRIEEERLDHIASTSSASA